MRTRFSSLRCQRGALLLEGTLALLVFAVGLLLLVRASCAAAQADAHRRHSVSVEQALLSQLEQLRARPFAALRSGADELSSEPGLRLRRSWTCETLWPGFVWIEVQVAADSASGPTYRSAIGRRR